MSAPEVTHHLLGVSCPDKPKSLMGTNHGVTWFVEQISCSRCRVLWDEMVERGEARLTEDGRVELPMMKIYTNQRPT